MSSLEKKVKFRTVYKQYLSIPTKPYSNPKTTSSFYSAATFSPLLTKRLNPLLLGFRLFPNPFLIVFWFVFLTLQLYTWINLSYSELFPLAKTLSVFQILLEVIVTLSWLGLDSSMNVFSLTMNNSPLFQNAYGDYISVILFSVHYK